MHICNILYLDVISVMLYRIIVTLHVIVTRHDYAVFFYFAFLQIIRVKDQSKYSVGKNLVNPRRYWIPREFRHDCVGAVFEIQIKRQEIYDGLKADVTWP